MLSYLHEFHAGNFADVHKHASLTLAMTMMQAKPSAIAGFDTHAGSAEHDLAGDRASKTGEADSGIQRVWRLRDRLQARDWSPMLAELARLNPDEGPLTRYPGSPAWFSCLQRAQDSLTAFELHSGESSRLQEWARKRRVTVQVGDGLEGLLGALPPRAPRLLVLIDPSYEIKDDYRLVSRTLEKAWARCRHGVFLVWYPMLTSGLHQVLPDHLGGSGIRKVWHSELLLNAPPERGMTGSGMLVVNPPWGFSERLDAMIGEVSGRDGLYVKHRQGWLVPE
ncbi:23S rRNA (adenine(2030)-N(6))-methyltransferase RlmJ [Marinobacter bryozoorum]|uniref:23S rRNA (adenine(2030)-N(6))-methyltransferase RlmJ n=1 Tax=Marinobacter bryozoorum TaxID=256324 RepID=UPI002006620D|nr:23S rRNA (adenine(2030)-N(6))-methyltransferase RlmJ [Marinobacter bryozoorum]MCK7545782.1 23S rRNA (adenine(2030)-N(6))-methyltransferase RlmJ [Marinobacter bryozoorum]